MALKEIWTKDLNVTCTKHFVPVLYQYIVPDIAQWYNSPVVLLVSNGFPLMGSVSYTLNHLTDVERLKKPHPKTETNLKSKINAFKTFLLTFLSVNNELLKFWRPLLFELYFILKLHCINSIAK